MTDPEPLLSSDHDVVAERVGEAIDAGKGRTFPCEQCGADLQFSIQQQNLACPFCGHVQPLAIPEEEIRENDYLAALERLETTTTEGAGITVEDVHEIRCEGCGANVVFQGTLTSSTCPYCASPLQRDRVHNLKTRIRVDAVVPFLVGHDRAATNLRNWVQSLWFAPNDFRQEGANGKFQGCYLPFYTFDAATFTKWSGERGDHYFETVRKANGQTEQVRRTRWSSAWGEFDKPFDDVLVLALEDDRRNLIQALEPWPLDKAQPFTLQFLTGFFARTYDVPLRDGFQRGKARMDDAIRMEIIRRIGGDEQRVTGQKSRYDDITFKHLLMPIWLMAYRYKEKTYRVTINAATGEVQGERPWSWIKITLFVLMWVVIALVLFALFNR